MIASLPISVLVVEDDPCFRNHFVAAIRDSNDLILAGEADDLPHGRRLLDATSPDVLLVDIGLPSGSGIELIRRANRRLPDCDVMVVTIFGDDRHVLECIEAGATGYLQKDASPLDIADQIRALRAGGSPISPLIARRLLRRFQPANSLREAPTELSPQEHTVLTLSTKGYRYEEIAQLLSLSSHTVETLKKHLPSN